MKHPRIRAVIVTLALASGAVATMQSAAPAATPDNPYAVVNAHGHILSGSGANKVTVLGTGTYEVQFAKNVAACAYTATPATSGVFAFVAGGHLSAKGVYVETKNLGGGLTSAAFHLTVWCKASSKWGVIGADGSIARGKGVTKVTTFPSLPGLYDVQFTGKTTFCVSVATVGDPADGLVFSPASIIDDTPRFNSRIVAVQTTDLAAFGGADSPRPFHVALLCDVTGHHVATVVFDGSVAAGNATAVRLGVGSYRATFASSIAGCATTAVAEGEEIDTAGAVWVRPTHGDPNSVDLHTTDLDGTAGDHTVSLIVSC